MTDPRPSENTDPIQLPGMRAAGFFDDLPKLTDGFFTQAELDTADDADPLMDLIDRAENAHDPGLGLVYAQLATTRAVMENTTQLRAIATALSTLAVIFDGGAR